ncbi:MAG: DNA-directed RNA polymerase subunit omega [Bacteroidales bacterium]|nr:DNA-directed RNA polymerase subunit omega [Bacteroidales bacterium]
MQTENNNKKEKIENNTATRNVNEIIEKTGNLYEAVVIMSKRANAISSKYKEELKSKLEQFATTNETLEEFFENREQIEVAKFYENLPKASLVAIDEFLKDKIYFRKPNADSNLPEEL